MGFPIGTDTFLTPGPATSCEEKLIEIVWKMTGNNAQAIRIKNKKLSHRFWDLT